MNYPWLNVKSNPVFIHLKTSNIKSLLSTANYSLSEFESGGIPLLIFLLCTFCL